MYISISILILYIHNIVSQRQHSRVLLIEVLEGQFDPQLHVVGTLQHAGLQVTDVIRLAVEVPLVILRHAHVGPRPALLHAPICQTDQTLFTPALNYTTVT